MKAKAFHLVTVLLTDKEMSRTPDFSQSPFHNSEKAKKMNEKEFTDQDFEDVAGVEGSIPDDAEIAKTPIKFSMDIVNRSKREFDIVEFNLSTGAAQVVEKSKAKRLGKAVMKERGAVIQTGKTLFDGAMMTVDVYHGRPLALEVAHQNLLSEYIDPDRKAERDERLKKVRADFKGEDRDTHIKQVLEEYQDLELSPEQLIEREGRTKQLILAGMIPETFSFEGQPAGLHPIEEVDELLLNALWSAYLGVNSPLDDEIYQVQVRRGTPIETKLMLSNTFEAYPLGNSVKVSEMPEDDLQVYLEREDARRNILVSSMIMKPSLSLNGEDAKNAYPIEELSEQMMQCLHNAYSAVNTPTEALALLRRFQRRK